MAVIDSWLNWSLSAALVMISGAFAGLTIALMTQDEIYLRVIAASGEANDRRNASQVIALLNQGKHWILVTLLLGNCIASEALPVKHCQLYWIKLSMVDCWRYSAVVH